jgi:hypothetical protein
MHDKKEDWLKVTASCRPCAMVRQQDGDATAVKGGA